jgi:hypothetical protein
MANHCWNRFSFFGNERVLEQVKQWQKQLNKVKPTVEDKFCMRAIREVFYRDAQPDDNLEFGSKWVHQDIDAISPKENQLGLQSAWCSPDELQKHLTQILHELDALVLIENFFWIENGDGGYVYTAVDSSGAVRIQATHADYPHDEFEEDEDADSHMDELLEECQVDALSDLLSEVPELLPIMKKHFSTLGISLPEDY